MSNFINKLAIVASANFLTSGIATQYAVLSNFSAVSANVISQPKLPGYVAATPDTTSDDGTFVPGISGVLGALPAPVALPTLAALALPTTSAVEAIMRAIEADLGAIKADLGAAHKGAVDLGAFLKAELGKVTTLNTYATGAKSYIDNEADLIKNAISTSREAKVLGTIVNGAALTAINLTVDFAAGYVPAFKVAGVNASKLATEVLGSAALASIYGAVLNFAVHGDVTFPNTGIFALLGAVGGMVTFAADEHLNGSEIESSDVTAIEA